MLEHGSDVGVGRVDPQADEIVGLLVLQLVSSLQSCFSSGKSLVHQQGPSQS